MLLTILVAALAGAAGASFASSELVSTGAAATAPTGAATALQDAYVSVFKTVSPSVVQIQTSAGLGSGIVFDHNGDIVTNDHVVGTATSFSVTTSTGKQLKGKLVGAFPEDDLAVIKVPGAGLTPATFADSDALEVGDIAIAIGNPLGLASSVTEGIVSALGRQEPEGNGVILQSAIQTSAAINPGNSGGALVNINGQVIGIPTLGASDPELGGAASGIGFAIPSNTVKSIASQLVSYGKVINSDRAYLGVKIADTGEANGVYLTQVLAGTGASAAGLKAGDLITALNGTATPTSVQLGTVLAALKPGQTVTVKFTRQNGSSGSVKLTLGQFPGGSN
jgi:S1-C subfamily serine protease